MTQYRPRLSFGLLFETLFFGALGIGFALNLLNQPALAVIFGVLGVMLRLMLAGFLSRTPLLAFDEYKLFGRRVGDSIKWQEVEAARLEYQSSAYGTPLIATLFLKLNKDSVRTISLKHLSVEPRDAACKIIAMAEQQANYNSNYSWTIGN